MKRRVIKLGTATLVASLPSKWIKEFGIKQGDYLDVEERKGDLVLSTEKRITKNEKILDFTNVNTVIALIFLQAAYNAGFEKIVINHNPQIDEYKTGKKIKTTEFLQKITKLFIGIEIIEQNENKTVLKDIGEVSDKESDDIISRALWLTKWTGDECLEAVKSNKKEALEEIRIRWENIVRFLNYYRRILAKKGYKDFDKTPIMLEITSYIREIADVYKFIAIETIELKKKYSPKTLETFEKINKSLEKFCSIFFKFSSEKAMEIVKERESIWHEMNKEKKKCLKEDAFLYGRLAVIVVVLLKALEDRFAIEI